MPYGKVKTDSIIYDNNGTDVELQSANLIDSAAVDSAITAKLATEVGTSIQPYDANTAFLDQSGTFQEAITFGNTVDFLSTADFQSTVDFTSTVTMGTCNVDYLNIEKGAVEVHEVVTNNSGSVTIDLSEGRYFSTTASTNTTFAFSNIASSTTHVQGFTVRVTCSGSGTTLTWPGSVLWDHDTPPTLTDGKTHIFVFTTDDGGNYVRGAALVDYNA